MSLSWVHAEEEVKQFSQGPSRPCSEVREPRHQPGYSPPHGTIGQRPWQPASLSRRAGAQRATSPISRADLAEHGHHQATYLTMREGWPPAAPSPMSHQRSSAIARHSHGALLPDGSVPSLWARRPPDAPGHLSCSPECFHFQEMTRRDNVRENSSAS